MKNIWNLKAAIYRLRNKGLFGKILKKENESVVNLLSQYSFEQQYVVDIGSGLGNALQLANNPGLSISIDSSFNMLKRQQQVHNDSICVNARVEKLPIQTASVDFVFVIGLMEYLSDRKQAINEIARILKQDGHGIITFSPRNIFTYLRWLMGSPLNPTSNRENQNLIETNFNIIDHCKTFMQEQYFIQKQ